MKAIILIVFFSPLCAFAQTLIPDANFEQALIDLNLDSAPLDGQVLTSQISTLTSLDVHGNSIVDLSGIEDFVALEHLDCSANNLQQLDVSNLLALKRLDCYNNQLEALDLEANTALERLDCSNNQLLALQLGFNTVLIDLTCDHNALTTLDLSNNSLLENLYCYKNNLIYLNVKNGNNVRLKNFHAGVNQLDCIDVDNEADAMTHSGVYASWVYDNNEGENVQYSEACNAPLASKLLFFSVQKIAQHAQLHWQVEAPVLPFSLQIEHSLDGKIFNKIAELPAPLESNGEYNHQHPSRNSNFYRLKLIEIDGRFQYSELRSLDFYTLAEVLRIYPNPVSEVLNFSALQGHNFSNIQILNQTGQVVFSGLPEHSSIDMADLPQGWYILVAESNGQMRRVAFVK